MVKIVKADLYSDVRQRIVAARQRFPKWKQFKPMAVAWLCAAARGGGMRRLFLSALLSLVSLVASADIVHVVELVSLDGVVSTNSDITLSTGRRYATSSAPSKSGWRFTHWSTTAKQEFSERDDWGRGEGAVVTSTSTRGFFKSFKILLKNPIDGLN